MSVQSMRQAWAVVVGVAVCLFVAPAFGQAADEALPNPFYSYCVGIGVGPEAAALPAQLALARLHAELGYDGMAFVGMAGAAEMLEALEARGQKLFAAYTPLNVEPEGQGYDPALKDLLPKLKGHGTIVWIVVNSRTHKPSTTDGDERAVALLREIADLAQESGVSISLYPHVGAYAQKMEDVVRLAKKVDRENVGVTFSLCHFMALDDVKNLDHVLELAAPYLTMVSINGTTGYTPDRNGWILTLDQGTLDLVPILRKIALLGYKGPIGYIAYGIRGEPRDILARSIQAWKRLSADAVKGEKGKAASGQQ